MTHQGGAELLGVADKEHRLLVTGALPAPWQSEKYFVDLVPGASVDLPGEVVFTCYVDQEDGGHTLRLVYRMGPDPHEFTAELCSVVDLSLLTGFPCVIIPRAIRPAGADMPAAVLLEFAKVVPQ